MSQTPPAKNAKTNVKSLSVHCHCQVVSQEVPSPPFPPPSSSSLSCIIIMSYRQEAGRRVVGKMRWQGKVRRGVLCRGRRWGRQAGVSSPDKGRHAMPAVQSFSSESCLPGRMKPSSLPIQQQVFLPASLPFPTTPGGPAHATSCLAIFLPPFDLLLVGSTACFRVPPSIHVMDDIFIVEEFSFRCWDIFTVACFNERMSH